MRDFNTYCQQSTTLRNDRAQRGFSQEEEEEEEDENSKGRYR
jgi:hypothetical protein